jgi:hypothetical protein
VRHVNKGGQTCWETGNKALATYGSSSIPWCVRQCVRQLVHVRVLVHVLERVCMHMSGSMLFGRNRAKSQP